MVRRSLGGGVAVRNILTAIFLLCSLGSLHSQVIKFNGVTYHLGWVDVSKSGNITNEYVPKGQTVDNWSSLIGVRQWPDAPSAEVAASAWVDHVKPLLVKDVETYERKGSGPTGKSSDIVCEAFLLGQDHSYCEVDVHRFVEEAGVKGVVGYQFAMKLPVTGKNVDADAYGREKENILDDISKLKTPLYRKMGGK